MLVKVDLHLHTNFSDGTFSPEQIVHKAVEAGVTTISITDHDTTSGLAVGKEICDLYGLNFIPGIEIGTKLDGEEIHILGYYVDPTDEKFQIILEELRDDRLQRGEKIVDLLNRQGIHISWGHVLKISSGESVGRPHIARALVDAGYAKNVKHAFDSIIGSEGPAFIERRLMTSEEAVNLLIRNSALAVLAHPLRSKFKSSRKAINNLENVLSRLIPHGLAGIEVYYGDYNEEQINYLMRLADSYDLVATGGSDYHGIGGNGEPKIGHRGPSVSVIADMESLRRKLET